MTVKIASRLCQADARPARGGVHVPNHDFHLARPFFQPLLHHRSVIDHHKETEISLPVYLFLEIKKTLTGQKYHGKAQGGAKKPPPPNHYPFLLIVPPWFLPCSGPKLFWYALLTTPKKINLLNQKVDEANGRADEGQTKIKQLELENLAKEQEITSLNHRNKLLEDECNALNTTLKTAKESADQGHASSSEVESLRRKVQLLEDEAEEADKNQRETTEK